MEFAMTIHDGAQPFVAHPFEIVISDLLLGAENFAESFATFQQRNHAVRLVALTTVEMVAERIRTSQSGVESDWVKPFASEEFLTPRKKFDKSGGPELFQTRRGVNYIFKPEGQATENVLSVAVAGRKR